MFWNTTSDTTVNIFPQLSLACWLIINAMELLCCRSLDVQNEMGYPPFSYFKRNFPSLFINIYNVIKSMKDITERPSLEEFF